MPGLISAHLQFKTQVAHVAIIGYPKLRLFRGLGSLARCRFRAAYPFVDKHELVAVARGLRGYHAYAVLHTCLEFQKHSRYK